MKLKSFLLLALTVCTFMVLSTGIVKAVFISGDSVLSRPETAVVAQRVAEEEMVPPEIEAINQATVEYLQGSRENLSALPSITRTVMDGDYAIATWTWGEAGGQSVLTLTDERWTVITSGGGAVDVATLEEAGVPTDIAERLIESDRAGW